MGAPCMAPLLPGACRRASAAEHLLPSRVLPGQGWRRQVRGCASLLSCTCCTSGKYKQLSDVNWDYPVGGPPGLGPNMCFFFFLFSFFSPFSFCSLALIAVLSHSLQCEQAAGGRVLAAPTQTGNAHANACSTTWTRSPHISKGC